MSSKSTNPASHNSPFPSSLTKVVNSSGPYQSEPSHKIQKVNEDKIYTKHLIDESPPKTPSPTNLINAQKLNSGVKIIQNDKLDIPPISHTHLHSTHKKKNMKQSTKLKDCSNIFVSNPSTTKLDSKQLSHFDMVTDTSSITTKVNPGKPEPLKIDSQNPNLLNQTYLNNAPPNDVIPPHLYQNNSSKLVTSQQNTQNSLINTSFLEKIPSHQLPIKPQQICNNSTSLLQINDPNYQLSNTVNKVDYIKPLMKGSSHRDFSTSPRTKNSYFSSDQSPSINQLKPMSDSHKPQMISSNDVTNPNTNLPILSPKRVYSNSIQLLNDVINLTSTDTDANINQNFSVMDNLSGISHLNKNSSNLNSTEDGLTTTAILNGLKSPPNSTPRIAKNSDNTLLSSSIDFPMNNKTSPNNGSRLSKRTSLSLDTLIDKVSNPFNSSRLHRTLIIPAPDNSPNENDNSLKEYTNLSNIQTSSLPSHITNEQGEVNLRRSTAIAGYNISDKIHNNTMQIIYSTSLDDHTEPEEDEEVVYGYPIKSSFFSVNQQQKINGNSLTISDAKRNSDELIHYPYYASTFPNNLSGTIKIDSTNFQRDLGYVTDTPWTTLYNPEDSTPCIPGLFDTKSPKQSQTVRRFLREDWVTGGDKLRLYLDSRLRKRSWKSAISATPLLLEKNTSKLFQTPSNQLSMQNEYLDCHLLIPIHTSDSSYRPDLHFNQTEKLPEESSVYKTPILPAKDSVKNHDKRITPQKALHSSKIHPTTQILPPEILFQNANASFSENTSNYSQTSPIVDLTHSQENINHQSPLVSNLADLSNTKPYYNDQYTSIDKDLNNLSYETTDKMIQKTYTMKSPPSYTLSELIDINGAHFAYTDYDTPNEEVKSNLKYADPIPKKLPSSVKGATKLNTDPKKKPLHTHLSSSLPTENPIDAKQCYTTKIEEKSYTKAHNVENNSESSQFEHSTNLINTTTLNALEFPVPYDKTTSTVTNIDSIQKHNQCIKPSPSPSPSQTVEINSTLLPSLNQSNSRHENTFSFKNSRECVLNANNDYSIKVSHEALYSPDYKQEDVSPTLLESTFKEPGSPSQNEKEFVHVSFNEDTSSELSDNETSIISLPQHFNSKIQPHTPQPIQIFPDSLTEALHYQIHLRQLLEQGIIYFNMNAHKGIQFLIDKSILQSEPQSVSMFLHLTNGIDKRQIGDYIGHPSEFCLSVLNHYCRLLDFSELTADEALRYFLSRFHPPGESQVVYRILERFSNCYFRDNPKSPLSSDQVHTYSYALVMLNTSLHKAEVKQRFSKTDFLNMILAARIPISKEQLEETYDRILTKPFKTTFSQSEQIYGRLARNPATVKMYTADICPVIDHELLQYGSNFLKFGRHGRPHLRHLWLSNDRFSLCWIPYKKPNASKHPMKVLNQNTNQTPYLHCSKPQPPKSLNTADTTSASAHNMYTSTQVCDAEHHLYHQSITKEALNSNTDFTKNLSNSLSLSQIAPEERGKYSENTHTQNNQMLCMPQKDTKSISKDSMEIPNSNKEGKNVLRRESGVKPRTTGDLNYLKFSDPIQLIHPDTIQSSPFFTNNTLSNTQYNVQKPTNLIARKLSLPLELSIFPLDKNLTSKDDKDLYKVYEMDISSTDDDKDKRKFASTGKLGKSLQGPPLSTHILNDNLNTTSPKSKIKKKQSMQPPQLDRQHPPQSNHRHKSRKQHEKTSSQCYNYLTVILPYFCLKPLQTFLNNNQSKDSNGNINPNLLHSRQILLKDIIGIQVGNNSSQVLRKNHVAYEWDNRCISIKTHLRTLDLYAPDDLFPPLQMWIAFFHSVLQTNMQTQTLKTQEQIKQLTKQRIEHEINKHKDFRVIILPNWSSHFRYSKTDNLDHSQYVFANRNLSGSSLYISKTMEAAWKAGLPQSMRGTLWCLVMGESITSELNESKEMSSTSQNCGPSWLDEYKELCINLKQCYKRALSLSPAHHLMHPVYMASNNKKTHIYTASYIASNTADTNHSPLKYPINNIHILNSTPTPDDPQTQKLSSASNVPSNAKEKFKNIHTQSKIHTLSSKLSPSKTAGAPRSNTDLDLPIRKETEYVASLAGKGYPNCVQERLNSYKEKIDEKYCTQNSKAGPDPQVNIDGSLTTHGGDLHTLKDIYPTLDDSQAQYYMTAPSSHYSILHHLEILNRELNLVFPALLPLPEASALTQTMGVEFLRSLFTAQSNSSNTTPTTTTPLSANSENSSPLNIVTPSKQSQFVNSTPQTSSTLPQSTHNVFNGVQININTEESKVQSKNLHEKHFDTKIFIKNPEEQSSCLTPALPSYEKLCKKKDKISCDEKYNTTDRNLDSPITQTSNSIDMIVQKDLPSPLSTTSPISAESDPSSLDSPSQTSSTNLLNTNSHTNQDKITKNNTSESSSLSSQSSLFKKAGEPTYLDPIYYPPSSSPHNNLNKNASSSQTFSALSSQHCQSKTSHSKEKPNLYTNIKNESSLSKPKPETELSNSVISLEELKRNQHIEVNLLQTKLNIPNASTLFSPSETTILQAVQQVIGCYIVAHPEIGYVRGMAQIATLLAYHMKAPLAYFTLSNLFQFDLYQALFSFDPLGRNKIKKHVSIFNKLFVKKLPELYKYFTALSVTAETYFIPWLLHLFTQSLPLHVICRLWDRIFLYRENYIFQAALGLLLYHTHALQSSTFEGCINLLHTPPHPDTFDEEKFFSCLEACSLSTKDIDLIKNSSSNK